MVLRLDRSVEQEATVLRRQLLRNIRVKEFAPEAIFADPFDSFVIPAVFCPFCNESRNMDICSDPDLQQSVGEGEECDLGAGASMDLSELRTRVRHDANRAPARPDVLS